MSQTGSPTQGELQRAFVAMLFAFAISVVAQQVAELLTVFTGNWTFAPSQGETQTGASAAWSFLSMASHSLLALLMLLVSWVMWSRSQAAGHLGDLHEVFSVKFLVFLVEVVLVTLYYSLSKSVEGDFAAYTIQKTVSSYITPSSARPEAMQMFFIFCIFAIWDYIVDVFESPKKPAPNGTWTRIASQISGVLTYCLISLICAAGAISLYLAAPINQTPAQAVAGDFGLIALLLFFNQGKTLEHYVFKLFPTEQTRSNTKRVPTVRSNVILATLTVAYVAFLIASSFVLCTPR